ncbi:hypothetical protein FRC07_011568 [Ceratobasidium sp. 392]|nr:hypothetical protein FRC07_011568 [Ceratobasidium sp. 392]
MPLEAIYEVLCAATNESQTKRIEQDLIEADSVTELALWNIADALELSITRELHYHGSEPDFTLAVGDLGRIEPSPLADELIGAKALIPFGSWHHAVSIDDPERKQSRRSLTKWQGHLSSRAMRLEVATPYFLDCDFPLSPESTSGWFRYDNVLTKVEGTQVNMCLLYITKDGSHSLDASRSQPPIGEADGPLFTVRFICVRLRFEIPDPSLLPRPVYFHRRPNPNAPPREYWGFISDHKDPVAIPSSRIQEIPLRYELHIQTTMGGDSWNARATASVDDKISRLPGAFAP